MKELVNALIPLNLKFFSVGSTLGIFLGLAFALIFSKSAITILAIVYLVFTLVGFWNLKDEIRGIFK